MSSLSRCLPILSLLALGACSEAPISLRTQGIIEGTPAPAYSGVVAISHDDASFLCGGTLIHPRLVVTALHCTLVASQEGDVLFLEPQGFRVGFGPNDGELEMHRVARVDRPVAKDEVGGALSEGLDVAVLWLDERADESARLHEISWDYVPLSEDQLTIVGYGRSSVEAPKAGDKLMSLEQTFQFDPESGILRLKGNGACEGDSGGPAFFGTDDHWIGVVSRSAFAPEDRGHGEVPCEGLTDLSTVQNDELRSFLEGAVEQIAVFDACASESMGGASSETGRCWSELPESANEPEGSKADDVDRKDPSSHDEDADSDEKEAEPGGNEHQTESDEDSGQGGESLDSGGCSWSTSRNVGYLWVYWALVVLLITSMRRKGRERSHAGKIDGPIE